MDPVGLSWSFAIDVTSLFAFRTFTVQAKRLRTLLTPARTTDNAFALLGSRPWKSIYLSIYPKNGPGGTRTHDQLIKSQLLYQLSYKSISTDIPILTSKYNFARFNYIHDYL